MPSFFEGLMRMLKGEPVFKPGEDPNWQEDKEEREIREAAQPTGALSPPPTEAQVQHRGPKIIPEATITHVENRINGEYLDVTVTIQNNSQINLDLEEINLLGTEYRLHHRLTPGEAREFVSVYNGPRLTHRNYTNCELYYQNESGDNFKAVHFVEFRQEADGTNTISRVRFVPPVQDV